MSGCVLEKVLKMLKRGSVHVFRNPWGNEIVYDKLPFFTSPF